MIHVTLHVAKLRLAESMEQCVTGSVDKSASQLSSEHTVKPTPETLLFSCAEMLVHMPPQSDKLQVHKSEVLQLGRQHS